MYAYAYILGVEQPHSARMIFFVPFTIYRPQFVPMYHVHGNWFRLNFCNLQLFRFVLVVLEPDTIIKLNLV